MAPFYGDISDWPRFHSAFSAEIDKNQNLHYSSKYNYLQALIKGKAKETIKGLPYSLEGYEEAIKLLTDKYGRPSHLKRQTIQDLEDLEQIGYSHKLDKIHKFTEKFTKAIRTLKTLGALNEAEGHIFKVFDKLGTIREFITLRDDAWESWKLERLAEELDKYCQRNPLSNDKNSKELEITKEQKFGDNKHKPDYKTKYKAFLSKTKNELKTNKPFNISPKCIYYKGSHYADKCVKLITPADRREFLTKNKLCFNCTSSKHSVGECGSNRTCFLCKGKHHTSICTKGTTSTMEESITDSPKEKNFSTIENTSEVTHPSLLVKVKGTKCLLNIDTMSSASYVGSHLIKTLGLKPIRTENKSTETLFDTKHFTKSAKIYNLPLTASNGYKLDIEAIRVEGRDYITKNHHQPNIKQLKQLYPKLRNVEISDTNGMHTDVLLGQRDFARIRTQTPPLVGKGPIYPTVELTKMGHVLSTGSSKSTKHNLKSYFVSEEASGEDQFKALWSLDTLGINDSEPDKGFDHEQFKDQITLKNGHYVTKLPWKPSAGAALPSNKEQAYARLGSTTRKLEKDGHLEDYDKIMKDQLEAGMLEIAPDIPSGPVTHVIPHSAVYRPESKTTPLRIVFDASAKAEPGALSLNDCLETGPNLLPKIFEIMVRNRFKKYVITGDIKKAFHQIHVRTEDRDAQRVLWYDNLNTKNPVTYRFTRVIFGATSSPYILNATIQKHLEKFQNNPKYTNTLEALQKDTYIDDIQGGGDNPQAVRVFKKQAEEVLKKGGFQLYKWNSNVNEFDDEKNEKIVKVLGTSWNKIKDTFSVTADVTAPSTLTKRKLLAHINGTFDVLGWAAPWMITAKLIFAQVCGLKTKWDDPLPKEISQQWSNFTQALKQFPTVTVPRAVCHQQGTNFSLHGFSDASAQAVCAAIYAVEWKGDQPINQQLLVAKSRIAEKNQTIPRLELVACHILAKLMQSVNEALDIPILKFSYCTDSSTALHWLKNQGTYRVYVKNRVNSINEMSLGLWSHVLTNQNPADLATRPTTPGPLSKLWLEGPTWLSKPKLRPPQPSMLETPEVEAEIVKTRKKDLAMITLDKPQVQFLEDMCTRYNYWKLSRIIAWLMRFSSNTKGNLTKGPLTT